MDTAFFVAAKLGGMLLRVDTWIVVLAVLAALAMWRGRLRLARGLTTALAALLVALAVLPLGDLAMTPLEASHPAAPPLDAPPDGIVVLGGAEDAAASRRWGTPETGEAVDRLLAAIALAHRFPEARVVYAGGSGRLRDVAAPNAGPATVAAAVLAGAGIAPPRLVLESASRNTAENARRTREMLRPAPGERWLLVTSASHMPRALASFRAAGWPPVTPWPVDFRSRAAWSEVRWDPERTLRLLNTALREWVGRAAYALAGR